MQNRLRSLGIAPLQLRERIAGCRILAKTPQRNREFQKGFRRTLAIREIREGLQKAICGFPVFATRESNLPMPILGVPGELIFRIFVHEQLKIGLSRGIFTAIERAYGLVEKCPRRGCRGGRGGWAR